MSSDGRCRRQQPDLNRIKAVAALCAEKSKLRRRSRRQSNRQPRVVIDGRLALMQAC